MLQELDTVTFKLLNSPVTRWETVRTWWGGGGALPTVAHLYEWEMRNLVLGHSQLSQWEIRNLVWVNLQYGSPVSVGDWKLGGGHSQLWLTCLSGRSGTWCGSISSMAHLSEWETRNLVRVTLQYGSPVWVTCLSGRLGTWCGSLQYGSPVWVGD